MRSNTFAENSKRAIRKARELGYKGLSDLDKNGTEEHKRIVKDSYKKVQ
jgi:hypothetical protein